MKLGYVSLPGRGENDLFLAKVAGRLCGQLKLCGTVQTNIERADRRKCDMDLRLLATGEVLRISEDRGALARGCTLDTQALTEAVARSEATLSGAELLIINKFGKIEAEGHGFAPLIAEALCRGIPVLVGVNALNLPAFKVFAGGIAQPLPPNAQHVIDWCQSARVANAA